MNAADRGVSDLIGFVFVFALVTASVAVVYTSGISGLRDARQAEQVTNVERAFDVLDDNLDDINRRDAPSRATEISLLNGKLDYGRPVSVTVEVENTMNESDNRTYATTFQPLRYSTTAADDRILYVGGAVVRSDGQSSVMVSEPDFTRDADRAVLPLVSTFRRPGTRSSLGGSTTVLVVAFRQSSSAGDPFFTNATADANVTVTVDSPRADAWKRYFERNGYTPADDDPSDGSVTYYFTTDRVYVPQTQIEFALKS